MSTRTAPAGVAELSPRAGDPMANRFEHLQIDHVEALLALVDSAYSWPRMSAVDATDVEMLERFWSPVDLALWTGEPGRSPLVTCISADPASDWAEIEVIAESPAEIHDTVERDLWPLVAHLERVLRIHRFHLVVPTDLELGSRGGDLRPLGVIRRAELRGGCWNDLEVFELGRARAAASTPPPSVHPPAAGPAPTGGPVALVDADGVVGDLYRAECRTHLNLSYRHRGRTPMPLAYPDRLLAPVNGAAALVEGSEVLAFYALEDVRSTASTAWMTVATSRAGGEVGLRHRLAVVRGLVTVARDWVSRLGVERVFMQVPDLAGFPCGRLVPSVLDRVAELEVVLPERLWVDGRLVPVEVWSMQLSRLTESGLRGLEWER
ncbi:MAG: hypothetical protein ACOYOQ_10450 [Microthrixaceae bacterium]